MVLLSRRKLRKWLSIADDIASILVQIRDKPNVADYASIGLLAVSRYLEHTEPYTYFSSWESLGLRAYASSIYNFFCAKFEPEVPFEDEDTKGYVFNLDGVKVGFYESHGDIITIFAEKGKEKTTMAAIGRIVWEHVGDKFITIQKSKTSNEWEPEVHFKVDNQNRDFYESKAAQDLVDRINLFVSQGINRSVMLYGEPGTGKSSAMRYAANKIGKFTLRISVSDMEHMNPEDFIVILDLLCPDVLLIDDFDRIYKSDKILSELESLNKKLSLILVSVNDLEKLEPAVIRPGRFSEIVEFNKIDDEIQEKMIGDVPPNIKKRLKKLPIAFLSEFENRRKILGTEQAIKEIEELEKRIRKMKKEMDDPDPVEKVSNKSSDNKKKPPKPEEV